MQQLLRRSWLHTLSCVCLLLLLLFSTAKQLTVCRFRTRSCQRNSGSCCVVAPRHSPGPTRQPSKKERRQRCTQKVSEHCAASSGPFRTSRSTERERPFRWQCFVTRIQITSSSPETPGLVYAFLILLGRTNNTRNRVMCEETDQSKQVGTCAS